MMPLVTTPSEMAQKAGRSFICSRVAMRQPVQAQVPGQGNGYKQEEPQHFVVSHPADLAVADVDDLLEEMPHLGPGGAPEQHPTGEYHQIDTAGCRR